MILGQLLSLYISNWIYLFHIYLIIYYFDCVLKLGCDLWFVSIGDLVGLVAKEAQCGEGDHF